MAKILTDTEMAGIVRRAVEEKKLIEDADAYSRFLADLAGLLCSHFGGERGAVCYDGGDGLGWTCGFLINDCVPPDGGAYRDCDTGVSWLDGKEVQA